MGGRSRRVCGHWLIGSAFQLLRQFVQPSLSSIRLDVLEGLAVDSCCSALGFAAFIGECQDIFPVHLVVQRVETKVGRFLRFGMVKDTERNFWFLIPEAGAVKVLHAEWAVRLRLKNVK
jgi:hypothetical protein